MRLIVYIYFLLYFGNAFAQQDAWLLSAAKIDSASGQIAIDSTKWVFKKGNDVSWAATSLDTKEWKKMPPYKLYSTVDASGKAEGWFRLKIKTDSSLSGMPLRLYSMTWGASDVYLNGKLLKSFGNTGSNGRPFEENNPAQYQSVAFPVEARKEYILAWHYIDYTAPIFQMLRSDNIVADEWLNITTLDFERIHYGAAIKSRVYDGILISVTVVLSLLFWLLAFLTPDEKKLKWIATGSSLLAMLSISVAFSKTEVLPFLPSFIFGMVTGIALILIFLLNPIILAHILNRKISKGIRVTLIVCTLMLISIFLLALLPAIINDAIKLIFAFGIIASLTVPFLISLYYLFSSWKNISGAQWAVVIGFLLSVSALVLYLFASATGIIAHNFMIPVLLYTVSPPLGMLVYVALRFKEMLQEVRLRGREVLQLSEEKREQAESQQQILEEEVEKQTADLKQTLSNLKSAQTQLVQAEKMASLGELTAGIAHEIQNPLNFVNNFSDVSIELLDEMETEIDKGDLEEAKAISSDIKQNLEKINFHGKRADAIVKGMLQHSRSSSGKKEPTDINALADEYLRLSYHGLRAKDKSFNANFKTDFDQTIEKIEIVPQDIGRVILNLLTNAFYAVDEKTRSSELNAITHPNEYKPTVTVSTKKLTDKIEVRIADNGNGIPKQIIDKIFQPFFTTKPTGKGTGLGLSLSYEIITQGHGGELKVETKEGEGTEFIICLPFKKTSI
jgi:two-component system NtrC family sensor kinase